LWAENEAECFSGQLNHHFSSYTPSTELRIDVLISSDVDVVYMCYKFGIEEYQLFSEYYLKVHYINNMTSTDRLVVSVPKVQIFEGNGVAAAFDSISWISNSPDEILNDLSCLENSRLLNMTVGNTLVGYSQEHVEIDTMPLPPLTFSLCYTFEGEPVKLYQEITILPCDIIDYNVAHGDRHIAVRYFPKMFFFHGGGFDAQVDRFAWTTSDASGCSEFPMTLASVEASASYSTGVVALAFPDEFNNLTLCYGFASEPFKVYEFVNVEVRYVQSAEVNHSVAGLNPAMNISFHGLGLEIGDRIKYVFPSISNNKDTWCESNGGTKEVELGSTSQGAVVRVSFVYPSVDSPYALCYGHALEPYQLYESITMMVDGIVSMSQQEFIAGQQAQTGWVGAGILKGDAVKWILNSEELQDKDCEETEAYHSDVIQSVGELATTFPEIASDETSRYALCYNFVGNDAGWRLYNDEDSMLVRAIGIRGINISHAVVGTVKTINFAGVGIEAGDVAKWIRFDEQHDCETAPSLTTQKFGDLVLENGVQHVEFAQPCSEVVLCYKFQKHSQMKLYKDIRLISNAVTSSDRDMVLINSADSITFQIAKGTPGIDKVKFIVPGQSCLDSGVEEREFDVRIVQCPLDSGIIGHCSQISVFFNMLESMIMCYYFAMEKRYFAYPEIALTSLKPAIDSMSSRVYVVKLASSIQLWGTFGITSPERFWFVDQSTENCQDSSSSMSAISSSRNPLNPTNGSATIAFNFNFATDPLKPLQLCFQFGTQKVMFKEHVLASQQIDTIQLLSSPDSSPMKFKFSGNGVSDDDKVKWVRKPGSGNMDSSLLCDDPMSEEQPVFEMTSFFEFANQAGSELLLCYKFNTFEFKPFPNAEVQVMYIDETNTDESALFKEQSSIDEKRQQEVKVQLSLQGDITSIPSGSHEETRFIATFTGDLASALGIPSSRIVVTSLSSGSIIVSFLILPPQLDDDMLSVDSLAGILIEKIQDVSSDLYTNSVLLSTVIRERAVDFSYALNAAAAEQASNLATKYLQPQVLEIIPYQPGGLFSFFSTIEVVVEDFDDFVYLTVVREHGANHTVPILYSTVDGTASSPEVYTAVSGILTFNTGERKKTIRVPISKNSNSGPHYTWFMVNLTTLEGLQFARLGHKSSALVKVFDYGDGEVLDEYSFRRESGTAIDTSGWQIVGNGNTITLPWVDYHGLYSSDQKYANQEYNADCDYASSLEPCTYSCEFGGSYANSKGSDDGVLSLSGQGWVASNDQVLSSSPETALTVSMWVLSPSDAPSGTLLSYHVPGKSVPEIMLHDHKDLIFVLKGSVTPTRNMGVRTGLNLADGKWHFLAITWQSAGGEVRVYKDGLLVFDGGPYRADETLSKNGVLSLGVTSLGCAASCTYDENTGFTGQLQNVRLWNSVRSQSQVQDEMKWPFTSFQGNLVLYWRFIHGYDSSENIAVGGVPLYGQLQGDARILDGISSPSIHPKYPCGEVNSNIFYFQAPVSGDIRTLYNGRIQFKMLAPSQHGTMRSARGAIRIISNQTTISNSLMGQKQPDNIQWRGFSAVLHEEFGWIKEPSGQKVSLEEFRRVLGDVSAIQVRGDVMVYSTSGSGQETSYINDFRLIKPRTYY